LIVARPKLVLDEKKIEYLASRFASVETIAIVLECSKDTLERRYAAIIKRGREKGKTTLMSKQFEVAEKGNVTMLIWLGKQHLGQVDKVERQIDPRDADAPVVYKTQWGKSFEEPDSKREDS
jgi:precorrin-4 methylase